MFLEVTVIASHGTKLVCIGNCIGKFFKHSRDVVVQGFHIRVMFVSHGFDVIANVVEVRF